MNGVGGNQNVCMLYGNNYIRFFKTDYVKKKANKIAFPK